MTKNYVIHRPYADPDLSAYAQSFAEEIEESVVKDAAIILEDAFLNNWYRDTLFVRIFHDTSPALDEKALNKALDGIYPKKGTSQL